MISSIGAVPVEPEPINMSKGPRLASPSTQRINRTTSFPGLKMGGKMKRSVSLSVFPRESNKEEDVRKAVGRSYVVAGPKPLKSCLSVTSLKDSLSTCSTESMSDLEGRKLKRNVSFHKVVVRSHSVCVGDNPSAEMGPPISLDWSFDPEENVQLLDDYELARGRQPRKRNSMYMPKQAREARLREEGFSEEEIKKGEAEKRKARMMRNHTKQTMALQPAQEVLESAGRKVKRIVTMTSKKKEQERLWRDAQKVVGKKEWTAPLNIQFHETKNASKEACPAPNVSTSDLTAPSSQTEEEEEHGYGNESQNDYDSDEGITF